MRISFIEVQNFRKLESIRIDFSESTTLLVGANNSGKTSAMVALGCFLVTHGGFTTNDFTLSRWATIDRIGAEWETQAHQTNALAPTSAAWDPVLPALDVWLQVETDEIHYVRDILPTLDWSGGLLGVRLRYEPKDISDLQKEYLTAINAAKDTRQAGAAAGESGHQYTLALWPENMRTFLDRKLRSMFTLRTYLLDPTRRVEPTHGIAKPQPLPTGSDPIEGNPLNRLICINEIAAQRGLADSGGERADIDGHDGQSSNESRKLSEQLRSYYAKHLDPSEFPEAADLAALQAIESAQKVFDDRLSTGFSAAIHELETLNYPGLTDPRLKIATRIRPTDGLNHNAAVQYEVAQGNSTSPSVPLRLPEEYNGLGYQNLISMVFKLMAFRDAWMRVGKAGKAGLRDNAAEKPFPPPLHLVLIEEPEAHLHCQVQQVFINQAYAVLRNHPDLKDKPALRTQLIVSTHSSHIAHECNFSSLRYFRRLPPKAPGGVPTSAVVNLSEVFGSDDQTEQFATRYLRAAHCDLFFADAAILIEGSAERILVPHFIRTHFPDLGRCYLTLLEIGGSHAHRLRRLIEHLGLITLIIADLDSRSPLGRHPAVPPSRGANQITGNETLKTWHPINSSLDELLNLSEDAKAKQYADIPSFAVRVAYQIPIALPRDGQGNAVEALATTFEDAMAFENLELFRALDSGGMAGQLKDAIELHTDPVALSKAFFDILKTDGKAELALELISIKDPKDMKIPAYIANGLEWLQSQVSARHVKTLGVASPANASGEHA
jgi:predicted ATP-dependent endonuclease of OLD family